MLHLRGVPQPDPTRPLVSVMIPTRGRPQKLHRAIESLQKKARNKSCFEILIKVDDDDKETLEYVLQNDLKVTLLVGPRGRGYLDIHNYIHEMARQAKGEWLMAFNDDAIMISENWDDLFNVVVVDEEGKSSDGSSTFYVDGVWHAIPSIVGRSESDELFAVTRRAFEVLGHLSLNMGVDVWLHSVFNMISRSYRVDISIEHENEPDTTYKQGRATIQGQLLYDLTASMSVRKARLRDAVTLLAYIEEVHTNKRNRLLCQDHPEGLYIEYAGRTGLLKNPIKEQQCLS